LLNIEDHNAATRPPKAPSPWGHKWRRTRYVLIRVVGIALVLIALAGGGSRLLTGTNEPIRIVAVGPEPEAVSTDALTHRAFVINQGDKSLDVIDTDLPTSGGDVGRQRGYGTHIHRHRFSHKQGINVRYA